MLEAAIIATAMSTIDRTERCTPPSLAPLAGVETPVLSGVRQPLSHLFQLGQLWS